MKAFTHRNAAISILMSMLLPLETANAQFGDVLKQGESIESSGGLKSLGSAGGALSGQSMTAGTTGNVAGLLEFCIKNNFLGGKDASSIKDQITGKLGGSPQSDDGYKDGTKGLLKSGDGKQLDLSGGGMKSEITKQVCDKVLAQGKSLL